VSQIFRDPGRKRLKVGPEFFFPDLAKDGIDVMILKLFSPKNGVFLFKILLLFALFF
jgi:hypothetical protein